MQHKSELEFLNSVFSFLQRRTKYFHPDNKDAADNFESLIEVMQHQKMQVLVALSPCISSLRTDSVLVAAFPAAGRTVAARQTETEGQTQVQTQAQTQAQVPAGASGRAARKAYNRTS